MTEPKIKCTLVTTGQNETVTSCSGTTTKYAPDGMYKTSNQVYGSHQTDPVELCASTASRLQCTSLGGVCVPLLVEECPRLKPELLPVAGQPSTRPVCCKQPSIDSGSCQSHHFEPSYCSEPESMKNLVSHEYKGRWHQERIAWAKACSAKLPQCQRQTSRRCLTSIRLINNNGSGCQAQKTDAQTSSSNNFRLKGSDYKASQRKCDNRVQTAEAEGTQRLSDQNESVLNNTNSTGLAQSSQTASNPAENSTTICCYPKLADADRTSRTN